MTRQQESHQRLRRIGQELEATRYALRRAEAKWDAETGTATAEFRDKTALPEIRRASDYLDRTYLLRLFAEFEAILLDYWQHGMGRRTSPKVFVLINHVGDSCPVPVSAGHRDEAHDVRRYRNSLVHARAEPVQPLTVEQCMSRLGRYLAYLPQDW